MFGFKKATPEETAQVDSGSDVTEDPLAGLQKNTWEKIWPTLACGAGLFSDGYLNSVCLSPPRPFGH